MSAVKKPQVSREAIDRFAERYPDGSDRATIEPRLQLALELARKGKCVTRPARSAALVQDPNFANARKIVDVELPPDKWNPDPYTIRIVATSDLAWVITVLPPEFRRDMHAKQKHRELRRIIDEDIVAELESKTERVELLPPVQFRSSLGDALRKAMSR